MDFITVDEHLFNLSGEHWSAGRCKVGYAGGGVTLFMNSDYTVETTNLCKIIKFSDFKIYIFKSERVSVHYAKKFLKDFTVCDSVMKFSIERSPRKSAFAISHGTLYEAKDHQQLVIEHDTIDVLGIRYPTICCLFDIDNCIIEYSDSHPEYIIMENLSKCSYSDVLKQVGIANYKVIRSSYLNKVGKYTLIDNLE